MKYQRLDLYSHVSHELAYADLQVIEVLDNVRLLTRRSLENPQDRETKRELAVQKATFWKSIEVRESVALDLVRVNQRRG